MGQFITQKSRNLLFQGFGAQSTPGSEDLAIGEGPVRRYGSMVIPSAKGPGNLLQQGSKFGEIYCHPLFDIGNPVNLIDSVDDHFIDISNRSNLEVLPI